MQADLLEMEIGMTNRIADHSAPFLSFLIEFDIDYSTVAMAILLDPRFMGGYLFIEMATSMYGGNAEIARTSAMELMMQYKDK